LRTDSRRFSSESSKIPARSVESAYSMPPLRFGRAIRNQRTFCATAAILAVALADPCVEFASNAGWFGPGHFTDGSNADVIPALLVSGVFLVLQMLRILRNAAIPVHATRSRTMRLSLPALLPQIFIAQIALLFVLESVEQVFVCGHLLGVTIWLGAPITISLAIHAVFTVGVATALHAGLRRFARHAPGIIRATRLQLRCLVDPAVILRRNFSDAAALFSAVTLCHIGERSPPILLRILPTH